MSKRLQIFEVRIRRDGRILSLHVSGTKERAEQRGRAVGHVISVRKVQPDYVLGNIESILHTLPHGELIPPAATIAEPETVSLEDMFFHQPKRRRENNHTRAVQGKYAEEV